MSVRVDFYILPDATARGRLTLACKLAQKAYDNGHRVYILTTDAAEAEVMDNLLWTFKQNSFVPHVRYPAPAEDTAPVWISNAPPPEQADDVLINLTADLPPCLEQFQRVLELVDQHPDVLAASRQRFRAYRAQGIEPASHQLPSG
jgi:DNA polymerase-3 subunit chi